jgi:hypothetical protein
MHAQPGVILKRMKRSLSVLLLLMSFVAGAQPMRSPDNRNINIGIGYTWSALTIAPDYWFTYDTYIDNKKFRGLEFSFLFNSARTKLAYDFSFRSYDIRYLYRQTPDARSYSGYPPPEYLGNTDDITYKKLVFCGYLSLHTAGRRIQIFGEAGPELTVATKESVQSYDSYRWYHIDSVSGFWITDSIEIRSFEQHKNKSHIDGFGLAFRCRMNLKISEAFYISTGLGIHFGGFASIYSPTPIMKTFNISLYYRIPTRKMVDWFQRPKGAGSESE